MRFIMTSFVILLAFSSAAFAGRPVFYPFDVKVAGQLATPTGNSVAVVANPVSADSEVEVVASVTDTMFVNAFASDATGKVANTTSPEVIMVSGTNKFKLNQTMSKKSLAPGTYMMNIMANNETSRVLFTVK